MARIDPDHDAAQIAADASAFWVAETRRRLVWAKPPTVGLVGDFRSVPDAPVRWFEDGALDVTASCVDRHAIAKPDTCAILWEGDTPGDVRTLTWRDLHEAVCRCAHALTNLGVAKGDRVIVYMGMVPEAAIAMLACARIGAVHSVVFGGFSAEALRDRILDCDASVVITQDEGRRGGRIIPLKAAMDEALTSCPGVRHSLVFRHTGAGVAWQPGRDVDWAEALAASPATHEGVICDAEDPLFILYTSGSTGRPKGLMHTRGGYLTWASYTHELVFDLRPDDVFACVADVGWITGHSYIVYGPLANGATTVMFESTPVFPDAGRYWDMVERHRFTILYTAPTALRALKAQSDAFVAAYDRSSLRVLGSVGEPIDPETWRWYHDVVGGGRCAVVDTWWQTETGGILISPIANRTPTKPGSASQPLPGVTPLLVDEHGHVLEGPAAGRLCLRTPWPGIARTVWGDHARYVQTYFSTYPPYYFTGDGCRRDDDGDHWVTGRVDDVLNVSGHRMGTAEFEAALVDVDVIAEAAVVGFPHALKGQGVWAFVVVQAGQPVPDDLVAQARAATRRVIGAHAHVDVVQVVVGLPKTRSGKCMRRILRKVAEGDTSSLGDTSTLADPSVVDAIVAGALSLRAS